MFKKLLLIITTVMMFVGCESEDSTILYISRKLFKVSYDKTQVQFTIDCNAKWTASSNAAWCKPTVVSGTGTQIIKFEVYENDGDARTAVVSIKSGSIVKNATVEQSAKISGTLKVPVVFHVLYADKNNAKQYVEAGHLAQIMSRCNEYYAGKNEGSVDLGIEFVMADKDPNGFTLTEAGVDRVKWSNPTMNCETFMVQSNSENVALLWDTDKYVNIVLYAFSNNSILGVSHLPYTFAEDPLPGLNVVKTNLVHENLAYPQCVSINNEYIYDIVEEGSYSSSNIVVTISHELGHYLGLFHAFSEDYDGSINLCKDSDYCADTPTYNRAEYSTWMNKYLRDFYANNNGGTLGEKELNDLYQRSCHTGVTFTSTNVMDYFFSKANCFTTDQKNRMHHVLSYSPLVPYVGKVRNSTRAHQSGPMELPMRIIY